jgi:AcrR family transcriptional regulator
MSNRRLTSSTHEPLEVTVSDSRQQMLDTAVDLFRRHGYNGTGFRQVVAESGAPRGSMYHHFPGGKAQLGIEAVTLAGAFINDLFIAEARKADDFVTAFENVWSWWINFVEDSEFAGCPILAVAAESHPEAPGLTAAAEAVFARWQATMKMGLERSGLSAEEAEDFALLILSALEGATVLSRASGNREALARVGRTLATILRDRIPRQP